MAFGPYAMVVGRPGMIVAAVVMVVTAMVMAMQMVMARVIVMHCHGCDLRPIFGSAHAPFS
jgi:hypothetical protein